MNCKKSIQMIKRTLTFMLSLAMVITSLYVAPVAYAVEEEVLEETTEAVVTEEPAASAVEDTEDTDPTEGDAAPIYNIGDLKISYVDDDAGTITMPYEANIGIGNLQGMVAATLDDGTVVSDGEIEWKLPTTGNYDANKIYGKITSVVDANATGTPSNLVKVADGTIDALNAGTYAVKGYAFMLNESTAVSSYNFDEGDTANYVAIDFTLVVEKLSSNDLTVGILADDSSKASVDGNVITATSKYNAESTALKDTAISYSIEIENESRSKVDAAAVSEVSATEIFKATEGITLTKGAANSGQVKIDYTLLAAKASVKTGTAKIKIEFTNYTDLELEIKESPSQELATAIDMVGSDDALSSDTIAGLLGSISGVIGADTAVDADSIKWKIGATASGVADNGYEAECDIYKDDVKLPQAGTGAIKGSTNLVAKSTYKVVVTTIRKCTNAEGGEYDDPLTIVHDTVERYIKAEEIGTGDLTVGEGPAKTFETGAATFTSQTEFKTNATSGAEEGTPVTYNITIQDSSKGNAAIAVKTIGSVTTTKNGFTATGGVKAVKGSTDNVVTVSYTLDPANAKTNGGAEASFVLSFDAYEDLTVKIVDKPNRGVSTYTLSVDGSEPGVDSGAKLDGESNSVRDLVSASVEAKGTAITEAAANLWDGETEGSGVFWVGTKNNALGANALKVGDHVLDLKVYKTATATEEHTIPETGLTHGTYYAQLSVYVVPEGKADDWGSNSTIKVDATTAASALVAQTEKLPFIVGKADSTGLSVYVGDGTGVDVVAKDYANKTYVAENKITTTAEYKGLETEEESVAITAKSGITSLIDKVNLTGSTTQKHVEIVSFDTDYFKTAKIVDFVPAVTGTTSVPAVPWKFAYSLNKNISPNVKSGKALIKVNFDEYESVLLTVEVEYQSGRSEKVTFTLDSTKTDIKIAGPNNLTYNAEEQVTVNEIKAALGISQTGITYDAATGKYTYEVAASGSTPATTVTKDVQISIVDEDGNPAVAKNAGTYKILITTDPTDETYAKADEITVVIGKLALNNTFTLTFDSAEDAATKNPDHVEPATGVTGDNAYFIYTGKAVKEANVAFDVDQTKAVAVADAAILMNDPTDSTKKVYNTTLINALKEELVFASKNADGESVPGTVEVKFSSNNVTDATTTDITASIVPTDAYKKSKTANFSIATNAGSKTFTIAKANPVGFSFNYGNAAALGTGDDAKNYLAGAEAMVELAAANAEGNAVIVLDVPEGVTAPIVGNTVETTRIKDGNTQDTTYIASVGPNGAVADGKVITVPVKAGAWTNDVAPEAKDNKFSFEVSFQNYKTIKVTVTLNVDTLTELTSTFADATTKAGIKWGGLLGSELDGGEIGYVGRALSSADIDVPNTTKEAAAAEKWSLAPVAGSLKLYQKIAEGSLVAITPDKIEEVGDTVYVAVATMSYDNDTTADPAAKNYKYSKEFSIVAQKNIVLKDGAKVSGLQKKDIDAQTIAAGRFATALTYGEFGNPVVEKDIAVKKDDSLSYAKFLIKNLTKAQKETTDTALIKAGYSIVDLTGNGLTAPIKNPQQPWVLIEKAADSKNIDANAKVQALIEVEGATEAIPDVDVLSFAKCAVYFRDNDWKLLGTQYVDRGSRVAEPYFDSGILGWAIAGSGKAWNFATDIADWEGLELVAQRAAVEPVEAGEHTFQVLDVPVLDWTGKAAKPPVTVLMDGAPFKGFSVKYDSSKTAGDKKLTVTIKKNKKLGINDKKEIAVNYYVAPISIVDDGGYLNVRPALAAPKASGKNSKASVKPITGMTYGKTKITLGKDFSYTLKQGGEAVEGMSGIKDNKAKSLAEGYYDVYVTAISDNVIADDVNVGYIIIAPKANLITSKSIKIVGKSKFTLDGAGSYAPVKFTVTTAAGTATYEMGDEGPVKVEGDDVGVYVDVWNAQGAGKGTIAIAGQGDFAGDPKKAVFGEATKTFTINAPKLSTKKAVFKDIKAVDYSGNGVTLEEAMGMDSAAISKALGFNEEINAFDNGLITVKYAKNINAGKATATLYAGYGSGLSGNLKVTYKINKIKLSNEDVVLMTLEELGSLDTAVGKGKNQKFVYDPSDIAGLFRNIKSDQDLVLGKDFTVKYKTTNKVMSKNKRVDESTIEIKGKGNYSFKDTPITIKLINNVSVDTGDAE